MVLLRRVEENTRQQFNLKSSIAKLIHCTKNTTFQFLLDSMTWCLNSLDPTLTGAAIGYFWS